MCCGIKDKEIGNEKANDIVDLYAVIGIGRM